MFPTGQDEYSEKNLFQLQVIHHKPHVGQNQSPDGEGSVRMGTKSLSHYTANSLLKYDTKTYK